MKDTQVDQGEPRLERDERGLYLTDGKLQIRGDFARMSHRLRKGNLSHELLVRAAKLPATSNRPVAVDATAGLGEDSMLLAAAGFDVLLFERNPVIASLLVDAVERARTVPEVSEAAMRMNVMEGDSIQRLVDLPFVPDIVFLDPMFPGKHKKSAVKKKLQLLQKLETPCEDESALLDAAYSARPRKIVVKRPVKGPWLAERKPSYSLSGKAIRYDCYIPSNG